MPFRAPLQPSQRSLEGVPGHALVGTPGHHVVEGHRDVGAQGPLNLRGALRREPAAEVASMSNSHMEPSAECGVRNAQSKLVLRFRTPHSAFRTYTTSIASP